MDQQFKEKHQNFNKLKHTDNLIISMIKLVVILAFKLEKVNFYLNWLLTEEIINSYVQLMKQLTSIWCLMSTDKICTQVSHLKSSKVMAIENVIMLQNRIKVQSIFFTQI